MRQRRGRGSENKLDVQQRIKMIKKKIIKLKEKK
jgi:hypothetical protein